VGIGIGSRTGSNFTGAGTVAKLVDFATGGVELGRDGSDISVTYLHVTGNRKIAAHSGPVSNVIEFSTSLL
jgi:hypothetical protein